MQTTLFQFLNTTAKAPSIKPNVKPNPPTKKYSFQDDEPVKIKEPIKRKYSFLEEDENDDIKDGKNINKRQNTSTSEYKFMKDLAEDFDENEKKNNEKNEKHNFSKSDKNEKTTEVHNSILIDNIVDDVVDLTVTEYKNQKAIKLEEQKENHQPTVKENNNNERALKPQHNYHAVPKKPSCAIICERTFKTGQKIQIRHGDITQEDSNAIVNAANSSLIHGSGVAGAVIKEGGHKIQRESYKWVEKHGNVPVGECVITSAGDLDANYVIHAVGPIWDKGNKTEKQQLHEACWNSIQMAECYKLRTISIPAISSGIFGFPKDLCARILIKTALHFFEKFPNSHLKEVRFTNKDEPTVNIFEETFNKLIKDVEDDD